MCSFVLLSLWIDCRVCIFSCSPEITEEQVIEIRGGRNPVIDLLMGEGEQYVPNDTSMSVSCNELSALFMHEVAGTSHKI